jgi:hypothetical protein
VQHTHSASRAAQSGACSFGTSYAVAESLRVTEVELQPAQARESLGLLGWSQYQAELEVRKRGVPTKPVAVIASSMNRRLGTAPLPV